MRPNLRSEEFWHAATHGLGVVLGIIGMGVLYVAFQPAPVLAQNAVWAYSISAIVLFSASTLYHSVPVSVLKERLRIFDHISIYYLIAGTYTPVTLIVLEHSRGWPIFYAVWGLALFGTFLKLSFTGRFETFSLLLYLIMGWMIVFDLDALWAGLDSAGKSYLLIGGICYTVGIIFYVVRKIPYNHIIWHLFVLAGAIFHWLLIRGLA